MTSSDAKATTPPRTLQEKLEKADALAEKLFDKWFDIARDTTRNKDTFRLSLLSNGFHRASDLTDRLKFKLTGHHL